MRRRDIIALVNLALAFLYCALTLAEAAERHGASAPVALGAGLLAAGLVATLILGSVYSLCLRYNTH